jgi:stage II sporulation protein D
VSGVGSGHGVGLCQRGAVGMARSGKDFRLILANYFPNTTIEVWQNHAEPEQ